MALTMKRDALRDPGTAPLDPSQPVVRYMASQNQNRYLERWHPARRNSGKGRDSCSTFLSRGRRQQDHAKAS